MWYPRTRGYFFVEIALFFTKRRNAGKFKEKNLIISENLELWSRILWEFCFPITKR